MGDEIDFQGMTGYMAGGGPAGVVVLHEWDGLVPHIRAVTDRVAAVGFTALAPDLYDGATAPWGDGAEAQRERAPHRDRCCSPLVSLIIRPELLTGRLDSQPISSGPPLSIPHESAGDASVTVLSRAAFTVATVESVGQRPRGSRNFREVNEMRTLRLAGIILALLLAVGCQSTSTTKSTSAAPKSPALAPSTTASQAGSSTRSESPVLVELDRHGGSSSTVTLLGPDGSVVASRTLPGDWVVGEHAVGAYLLVSTDGSHRAWTIDAAGKVREVAAGAAEILSTPSVASTSLIVDFTTAVVLRCRAEACSAERLDLRTGAVRELLTIAYLPNFKGSPLTILDVTADRHTVWLREFVGPGFADPAHSDIVGVDLQSGVVTTPARSTAILDQDLVITPDGTAVAGLEPGPSVGQYAVWHLHTTSLDGGVDADLQGTADLASAYTGLPCVLFAPDAGRVAWWGPLNPPAASGPALAINVASRQGSGKTLWRAPEFQTQIEGFFWLDPTTLLVQTDSSTTTGALQGAGLHTFTIDTSAGAQRPFPKNLQFLVAVLR